MDFDRVTTRHIILSSGPIYTACKECMTQFTSLPYFTGFHFTSMPPIVNDGGTFVGLLTDMKFMAYLFNFFACLYTTFVFKGNHFILCATVSSLCGALGTVLVAVHNTLTDHNGVIPVNAHIALLIPIEIMWGSSEFFAMITVS